MQGGLCTSDYHPYHKPTDMTDMTLGTNGHWLGTSAGAGGTVTIS
jgi:hypothetical protein